MANTIYYNGTIITMRTAEPEIAEAVLTAGGRIALAGTFEEAKSWMGEHAPNEAYQCRDLKGAALLPAFLDPHSHITALAQVMGYAGLSGVKSFGEIAQRLSLFKGHAGLKPGEWLVGVAYDHNFLKERCHPDKFALDKFFRDNPVMISHVSGHMGVVNSAALEQMGISGKTDNPEGGVIGRVGDTKEPNGYLEETAFTGAGAVIPRPSMEKLAKQLSMAEELYLSHGIATIQDGITRKKEWEMLEYMAENQLLRADVVSYADMKSDKALLSENPDYAFEYKNHLRIGGYKIFLDGSPQGRTAWMRRPYEASEPAGQEQEASRELDQEQGIGRELGQEQGAGRELGQEQGAGRELGQEQGIGRELGQEQGAGQEQESTTGRAMGTAAGNGYCGYPIYKTGEVESFFEAALRENRQLLVHCNGDAAAKQMIDACETAVRRTGRDPKLIRPVMVHAQLAGADELDRMAALSITASFFVAHTYYWGDIHLKNFGRERAFHISPARTAIRKNVNVTFHQDSPVILPDMMETIWCAVNRVSREGVVMGEDERVTPYEALKAVTINAAYQYGEEKEKGTLEPGKNADLVILNQNPLITAPENLKNIQVLETVKSGETLYRAPEER